MLPYLPGWLATKALLLNHCNILSPLDLPAGRNSETRRVLRAAVPMPRCAGRAPKKGPEGRQGSEKHALNPPQPGSARPVL